MRPAVRVLAGAAGIAVAVLGVSGGVRFLRPPVADGVTLPPAVEARDVADVGIPGLDPDVDVAGPPETEDGRAGGWDAPGHSLPWSTARPVHRDWEAHLPGWPLTPVVHDVSLVVRTTRTLARIDLETGRPQWRQDDEVELGLRSRPILAGDRIIVGGDGGVVSARDLETGHKLWAARPTAHRGAASLPAGHEAGVVAVVLTGEGLVGYDTNDGTQVWSRSLPGVLGGQVAEDGAVIVLARGHVVAVDIATGTPRWTLEGEPGSGYFRVAAARGRVVAVNRAEVVCLDARSGGRMWSQTGQPVLGGLPVIVDGVVAMPDATGGGTALQAFDLTDGDPHWRADLPRLTRITASDDHFVAVTPRHTIRLLDPIDGRVEERLIVPTTTAVGAVAVGGRTFVAGANRDGARVLALDP